MKKFEEVVKLNVNDYTEKKNGLTYISWSNAWREFCKIYPQARYTIQKDANGIPAFGNSKLGYMVYTSVTVDDITHDMWLAVTDHRNKAILEPDMVAINKAIMRCLTKNLAMFGLGLYIYAGEDLPDDAEEIEKEKERENIAKAIRAIKKLNKDKELNLILKELNSNLEELDTDKLKYIYNKLKVS
jgi:hypothetical protein